MNAEILTGQNHREPLQNGALPEWLQVVRAQVESLQFGTVQITLPLPLRAPLPVATYSWKAEWDQEKPVALQVSSNLVDWVSLAVVTNSCGVIQWRHNVTGQAKQFFRVLPQ